MPELDDFLTLDHRMGEAYNKLELLMAELHSRMENEQQLDTRELLIELGNIGETMLDTQKAFVEAYGNDAKAKEYQTIMLSRITNKEQALIAGNNSLKEKGY